MIANFDRRNRRGALVGVALMTTIAAALLTGPRTPPAQAQDAEGPRPVAQDTDLRRLHVERQTRPPRWRAELKRKLAREITLAVPEGDEVTLRRALDVVRDETGVNLVIDAEAIEHADEATVSLVAEQAMPAERLLTLLTAQAGLAYCFTDEAVYVGETERLPAVIEQRFYAIAPLLAEETDSELVGHRVNELRDLTMALVAEPSWTDLPTGMNYWNGLLCVQQTEANHARVETFLNLLLNRGRGAAKRTPEWRPELERRLQERCDVSLSHALFGDAVEHLQREWGVPVVIPEDSAENYEVNLHLTDVTRRQVLDWIARTAHQQVTLQHGAAVLVEVPPLEIRCYEVSDLLGGEDDLESEMELLRELLMHSVSPVSWEEYSSIHFWRDLFVVAQSERVHGEIAEFLASLRRALDR